MLNVQFTHTHLGITDVIINKLYYWYLESYSKQLLVQQSQDGADLCVCSCVSYSKQLLVQQSHDGADCNENVNVQLSTHDTWNNLHQVR